MDADKEPTKKIYKIPLFLGIFFFLVGGYFYLFMGGFGVEFIILFSFLFGLLFLCYYGIKKSMINQSLSKREDI